jgi:hypothetical protein
MMTTADTRRNRMISEPRPPWGRGAARLVVTLTLLMFACLLCAGHSEASIHHRLAVSIHAASGEITVSDEVSLDGPAVFSLAEGFDVSAEGGRLVRLREADGIVDYRLEPEGNNNVVLRYGGRVAGEGADIFGMPRAVVDGEGVFLDASSAWYPLFRVSAVTFDMEVVLPEDWELVGQGVLARLGNGRFRVEAKTPQEDIYLVAGPFTVYERTTHRPPLSVYLLQPDEALAARYLDAMGAYLDFYDALIGPYPHHGFAVVENRWQTGYGMPGFTLLGSRVLRLPFLLKTSLPHEILHNWFGNGIYIDAAAGNWSEGLTAYLADYLVKEAEGDGAQHRQRSLARYADFASGGRDVPVADFRSRHDDASQSVGYDKVLLVVHMLRHRIGDEAFVAGLRRFWEAQRFQRADFRDLLVAFESAGWEPEGFYDAWVARPGAPELTITRADAPERQGGYELVLGLAQVQQEAPYPLQVPVYVTLEGEPEARRLDVTLTGRDATVRMDFAQRPLRVDVDPAFETFRRLSELERPSALGRLFGAPRQWLVVPSRATGEVQSAWKELAQAWGGRYGNVEIVEDMAPPDAAPGDAVWLLGWDNGLLEDLGGRFSGQKQRLDVAAAVVDGVAYGSAEYAVVLLDPDNSRPPLGFIGADGVTEIRRLAAKLTHYGSFGRLVFDRPGMENRVRDRLAVESSPLSVRFDPAVPLNLPPELFLGDAAGLSLPVGRK